ncbi:MAG: 4Fe-4S dicluster domain-containing protein [bacterium]|nr:4Fe-4S dicluster domain-containing protein [bacterium]
MSLENRHQLDIGGINRDAGNSLKNFTGSCRRGEKPEFNPDTCINCFFCWVFCPENAIIVTGEKIAGINYDYCKGCGICVNECPVRQDTKPLTMVKENIEL